MHLPNGSGAQCVKECGMMDYNKSALRLSEFIRKATCSFTAVSAGIDMLRAAGFSELVLEKPWDIEKGGKYFVNVHKSSLFAFVVGEDYGEGSLRLVTSHTDSPALMVKPCPEVNSGKNNLGKLNVDVYGGAILNTWLDRPLSVAAKVACRTSSGEVEVRIVDCMEPVAVIPNLAIHLNREVNKGVELNRQVDMMPVCCQPKEGEDFFADYLARKAGVKAEDILDYEAFLYNMQQPVIGGMNGEFIISPRLDNLTSVMACLVGITQHGAANRTGINAAMMYDNEEIGSMTKQGANSSVLTFMLEKMYASLGEGTRSGYIDHILSGMMLSLDVAHASHPNHPEKDDVTTKMVMNAGPVIKRSISQKYATDAATIGRIALICQDNDIPYQKFSIRSDMTGGSTLGPIADIQLPMPTVDAGVAILAMHSSCETMGVKDQCYLEELVKGFYLE